MLAAEAERLAVFLAVVEQVPLVAFQHGPGNFGWLGETALGAPLQEEPDVHLAVADGVFGVVLHAQRIQVFGQQRGQRRPSGAWRIGFRFLRDARHHAAPGWLPVRRGFSLAARVVSFSGFGGKSPFRRASIAGDSSPAPPPDTPRTWGRLGADFSPFTPDFFSS